MPGDRFTFAVGVGREIHRLSHPCQALKFLDHFLLFVGDSILGFEVILNVHRELRTQQIANMPHRGLDRIAFSQKTSNCLGLGGRFNDHQLSVALLDLLGLWGGLQSLVRGSPSRAVKSGAADRTHPDGHWRTLRIKSCDRVLHLAFGLALHAIRFHPLSKPQRYFSCRCFLRCSTTSRTFCA